MWVDHPDALEIAAHLFAIGILSVREHRLITRFIHDGCVVMEGAIAPALIDAFESEISACWRHGHSDLRVSIPPNDKRAAISPELASLPGIRMLDVYYHFASARRLLLHDEIGRFLWILFNHPPLLFQSLSFPVGSEQGMHQDTAYVVTDSPRELAASWIALEDIKPGSGELQFYVGSHRMPEFHFGNGRKHYIPGLDSPDEHDRYLEFINANVRAMSLELRPFHAKKGDLLIWHADLVHGGAPITRRDQSRKSLVGHYCPADVSPNFFSYLPETAELRPEGVGFYCSANYGGKRRG